MECTIEIFVAGTWQAAARVKLRSERDLPKGYRAPTRIQYELDYAIDHLGDQRTAAVSCRYPVNFEHHDLDTWPAFLLDLLPSGAARRYFLDDQGIARVCRWGDAESAAEPLCHQVIDQVAPLGPDPAWLRAKLAHFGAQLQHLPDIMARHGVDRPLIERLVQ